MTRNQIVSPRFEEDFYKGQDVVHQGIRIPLSIPIEDVLSKFSRNAQRRCATPTEGLFKEVIESDLDTLRAMWFNPADETFPVDLKDHIGMVAMDADRNIIGGILWQVQGVNLFLHQLISNNKGKELQIPTRLIWESVNWYHGSFHSLDIGVSYNPKRYQFFKNFAVETYPIILKKPELVPVIRLSPFKGFEDKKEKADDNIWAEEKMTFFPRASWALYALLKHLKIGDGDVVCIVKTFGSNYISSCVTRMIEKTGAKWQLRENAGNAKAVIAIHEFGIPVFQEKDMRILDYAKSAKIPIIEDCAWRDSKVFNYSNYHLFSLTKTININYGGILYGVHLTDEFLWSIGCLDAVKRERFAFENVEYDMNKEVRAKNWMLYDSLVQADGMMIDDCYDYKKAIISGMHIWNPTVYLQKFESDQIADDIVARLEEFGIQAGRYWGEPIVFLPIHQNITEAEVEYMFAVVKGYFNSCKNYNGK